MTKMSDNPYEPARHSGEPPVPSRFRLGRLLLVICILGLIVALLLPNVRTARSAAERMQCANNLKQIALALHSYEEEFGSLPPAYTVDTNGRPLHSWRTLILPFLGEEGLYNSIDLSKPWDDPANAEALNSGPTVLCCPSSGLQSRLTTYLAVIAPDGCFLGSEPRQLAQITGTRSQMLMLIEAPTENAVNWMAPRDTDAQLVLTFGSENRLNHVGGTTAVFADGSTRFLLAEMSKEARREMMSSLGIHSESDEAERNAVR